MRMHGVEAAPRREKDIRELLNLKKGRRLVESQSMAEKRLSLTLGRFALQ